MKTTPSISLESFYLNNGYKYVIGIDEVGRGAMAGPVMVGVAVTLGSQSPQGLADSKLLSKRQRANLIDGLKKYTKNRLYIGSATVNEIDKFGINTALRIAALRALPVLKNSIILLDGTYDWLSCEEGWQEKMINESILNERKKIPNVIMVKKGDRDVSILAAASVYAKEARDTVMLELSTVYPDYKFDDNKGYLTAEHKNAIIARGYSAQHRKSYKIKDM